MEPCQRSLLPVACGLLLLAAASPAAADAVFWAPPSVQADGSGAFEFTALLTAGYDCVGWTGYHFEGVTNVTGGEWADTFCIEPQPVGFGEVISFTVSGTLTDPGFDGVMFSESAFCTGGGGSAETVVLAPTVPDDRPAWGGLKARYR